MAVLCPQYFVELAKYLQTPLGKICIDDMLPTRTVNNKTITGVFNIISSLLKESKKKLRANNLVEDAEISQWIEYTIVYVANISGKQNTEAVLKELNVILAVKTYLLSNRLTIADIFLYYVLIDVMNNLTTLDKERFLNVSRWFDNLQQNASLRQSHELIDFSTNYLSITAPARH